MPNYQQKGDTGVTSSEAFLILQRITGLAARTALGDGLTREEVATCLEDLALFIRDDPGPEDMSPIVFPME